MNISHWVKSPVDFQYDVRMDVLNNIALVALLLSISIPTVKIVGSSKVEDHNGFA